MDDICFGKISRRDLSIVQSYLISMSYTVLLLNLSHFSLFPLVAHIYFDFYDHWQMRLIRMSLFYNTLTAYAVKEPLYFPKQ